ncbi:hypothetical protein DPMN_108333 [Dreissena polymorpha]|uniref:Uncharacterized protein n=1 Tax=Dreissena polymorpha TaxID=45954 RepID=A0A9D4K8N8_DREPO|nr:hypothetical protein DPMN_108333 [Dreissena polymorpha]
MNVGRAESRETMLMRSVCHFWEQPLLWLSRPMRDWQLFLHNMHTNGLAVRGMAARAFRMFVFRVASSDLLA